MMLILMVAADWWHRFTDAYFRTDEDKLMITEARMSRMQQLLRDGETEVDLEELKQVLMLKIQQPHLRVGLWPDEWVVLLACVKFTESKLK